MPCREGSGDRVILSCLYHSVGIRLPQSPQEIQPLLSFLDQLYCVGGPCEVLRDVDPEVFKAAHPLHFKLPDKRWLMRCPPLPHVHYHLLRLVCVQGEVVVLAPIRTRKGDFCAIDFVKF